MNKQRTDNFAHGGAPFRTTGYQRDYKRRNDTRKRLFLAAALGIFGVTLFATGITRSSGTSPHEDLQTMQPPSDQVIASFVRELEHEPVPTQPITRESIDEDILYKTINAAHWTDDEQMERAVEACLSDAENTYPCFVQAVSPRHGE